MFVIFPIQPFFIPAQRRSLNPVYFSHTQLHTRLTEFLPTRCLLCLACKPNVPEVEQTCSRLFEKPIPISFLFVCNVHFCYYALSFSVSFILILMLLLAFLSLVWCTTHMYNFSIYLHKGDFQTPTIFLTGNFTQGWLNSYRLFVCFVLLVNRTFLK